MVFKIHDKYIILINNNCQELLSSKGGMIILILIPCLAILSYDIMKILRNIGRKTELIQE